MKHIKEYIIGDHSIRVNQSPYSNVPGNHIWEKFESAAIGNAVAFVYNMDGKIDNKNIRLIASAPDLYDELKEQSKILGRIIVDALQEEFEYLKNVSRHAQIEFVNGEPSVKSKAISKIEGGINENV